MSEIWVSSHRSRTEVFGNIPSRFQDAERRLAVYITHIGQIVTDESLGVSGRGELHYLTKRVAAVCSGLVFHIKSRTRNLTIDFDKYLPAGGMQTHPSRKTCPLRPL